MIYRFWCVSLPCPEHDTTSILRGLKIVSVRSKTDPIIFCESYNAPPMSVDAATELLKLANQAKIKAAEHRAVWASILLTR